MREPVSSPFTSFLAQHFDQINDYLATFFDGQATSADIERYLYAPLSAFTANAGKRHRPLICMLACKAVGGDSKGLYMLNSELKARVYTAPSLVL